MTTIAYRDGTLAADTRAVSGDHRPMGHQQKIFRTNDGGMVGVATAHPGLTEEIALWLAADKHSDREPQIGDRNFEMLEVTPDGLVLYYCNNFTPAGPLTGAYFAIGSGAEYAIGAMAMGATAEEGVIIAAANDPYTRAPIQKLSIEIEEAEDVDAE